MGDTHQRVRLGAAQVAEVYNDREATIEKDCRFIREAGTRDIDLLVFPEFHVASSPYWYWYDDDFDRFQQYYRVMFDNAVTVPGPATDELCEAANDAGVAVVIGVNEKEPDTAGTMYNSQLFIDANGTVLGVRRKLVPTRHERIFHTGGTGEDVTAFDSSLGTLGGLMCGEHTNPLAVYAVLAHGAEIHGAAWPAMPQPDRDQEYRERTICLRTRYLAFVGKVPTVSATGVVTDELADDVGGLPDTYADSGTSSIIAPDGTYLAGPKWTGEGIVHADVDMGDRVEGKAYHDILGHYNRFDIFQLTVDKRSREPLVTTNAAGGPTDVSAALEVLRETAAQRDDEVLREHLLRIETHLGEDEPADRGR